MWRSWLIVVVKITFGVTTWWYTSTICNVAIIKVVFNKLWIYSFLNAQGARWAYPLSFSRHRASLTNSDVCHQMLGLLIDNSTYALNFKCNHNANIQCSHFDSGFSTRMRRTNWSTAQRNWCWLISSQNRCRENYSRNFDEWWWVGITCPCYRRSTLRNTRTNLRSVLRNRLLRDDALVRICYIIYCLNN